MRSATATRTWSAAMKAAADKVWHTSNVFTIPEQERLGQRLVDATFADSVFFTNSGAEAVECAIKTARHYFFAKGEPERYEIIAFTGSFHGRTLGTIAAGGNPHYTEGFGPPLAGFKHVAPSDLAAVEARDHAKTCAILIEPVQGEGGVTAMTAEFMRGLRALCDKHGMLLILDEVQCGYGRTGKFFAHEWSGITPDIMAVAKGIGGGFPLGACLAKRRGRQVDGTGHAWLDLWRQPAGLHRRQCRARPHPRARLHRARRPDGPAAQLAPAATAAALSALRPRAARQGPARRHQAPRRSSRAISSRGCATTIRC